MLGFLRLVSLLAVLAVCAGCPRAPTNPHTPEIIDAGEDPPDAGPTGPTLVKLDVMPDPELVCLGGCLNIQAGLSRKFIAVGTDDAGTEYPNLSATWASSNADVATVDPDGTVHALSSGFAVISASLDSLIGVADLTVTPARIARITVTPNPAIVDAGTPFALAATAYDEHDNVLNDVTFSWTSSNPNIASVDDAGVVTGHLSGVAAVLATSDRAFESGWTSVSVNSDQSPDAGFTLKHVALGTAHGCGVSPDNVTWCWGWNYFGQLGVHRMDPATSNFPVPERVVFDGGYTEFSSLSLGMYHSCGLASDGGAWCWGVNDTGQLGVDSIPRHTGGTVIPYQVLGDHAFTSISAGASHTCGLVADGTAYCWGLGANGATGTGTTDDTWIPTPVATALRFKALATGLQSTCGLTTSGAAHCWGRNSMGQLGNGADISDNTLSFLPVPVAGGHTFTSLSLAASHACALESDGKAFCWGNNEYGQLGNNSRAPSSIPVQVNTTLRFTEIATGAHHTCGLTSNGAAFCWGNSFSGQLGNGALADALVPVKVASSKSFVHLVSNGSANCALTAASEALCWGSASFGETGGGIAGNASLFVAPWPVATPNP